MTQANDIEGLRGRLEETRGREYWRSLESLSETAEFKEFLHREFPQNASEWLDPVGRRGFLKLMGASLALAGATGCTRQPYEELVPYVRQPEEEIPGKPLFYATAMPMNGAGMGLLVETHEGRPTKIEGNPDHPSSNGATDLFAQAAILGLYDPDRSQTITSLGDIRPFSAFTAAARQIMTAQLAKQGSGLRILTETVASPTLAAQIRELLAAYPQAKWVQWEPVGRHNAREGSRLAFGEYVDPQYAIESADVILSLDADFLCFGAAGLKHSRAFASRRRLEGDRRELNRLYAVESDATGTGSRADHRLPMRASEIENFARAVAAQLGIGGTAPGQLSAAASKWIGPLVKDLQAARGKSVVIAGNGQPPVVHALAHAINEALGNVGTTVSYTETAEAQPIDQRAALRELVGEMNAGTVDFLLIFSANPVYSAPADLRFDAALQKVAMRVHLGLYQDETAAQCHWHIPETHFLETWSDVRSDDGTVTIVQPVIAPLYNGKSAHEVISALGANGERSAYDLVRAYWGSQNVVSGGGNGNGAAAGGASAPGAGAQQGRQGAQPQAGQQAGAAVNPAPGLNGNPRSRNLAGGPPEASAAAAQQAGNAALGVQLPSSTPGPGVPLPPIAGPVPGRTAGGNDNSGNAAATAVQRPQGTAAENPNNGGPAPDRGPATFTAAPPLSPFDAAWRRWLHNGLVPGTAFTPKTVAVRGGFASAPAAARASGLEVIFRPDPSIWDGRFANNAWLQELPKTLTKLTWDNAALIAPGTAARLNLVSGDVVELKHGNRSLRTPVWLSPGQALDTLTLWLGYGRTRAGRTANGVGVDVTPLRTADAQDFLTGVELSKTGETYELASTQDHWSLEGRNLVRVATTAEFAADPDFVRRQEIVPNSGITMLPEYKYDGYKWGMTIDQNVCTGCNACVVACQAENNVPVVGKAQVLNGREMHWLRIDRYYSGDLDTPDTYHQPMPCQQCETAPCELVCPVAATVHSSEGLNEMVYNRCVGTRYCSNNCPYKVRRFNFLLYQDWNTESIKLQRNPDVTVRSRGVMEKCTYCVQRISQARITAKLEDRRIRDGEVVTACQAACPTDAIVFGDINDRNSEVAKLKTSQRNYGLLSELNTRPRTSYMAIVRNPNTELEPPRAARSEGEA